MVDVTLELAFSFDELGTAWRFPEASASIQSSAQISDELGSSSSSSKMVRSHPVTEVHCYDSFRSVPVLPFSSL